MSKMGFYVRILRQNIKLLYKAQQNAAMVEELASSSESMSSQAQELQNIVQEFKLEE